MLNILVKRPFFVAGIEFASFILGAGCMFLLNRESKLTVPTGWISVASEGGGIGYESDALRADIPLPKNEAPQGRVKFLNRDKGIQLGYVLKLPMKPVPVSTLPEKYRKNTKFGDFEVGPPEQVQYVGHYDFVLKMLKDLCC